jgi:FMN phosphatase YigB (HAD superfamily)
VSRNADAEPARGAVLDLGSVLVRVDDFEQLASDVGAGHDADDSDHPLHRAERGEVTLTAAIADIEMLTQQRGFSIESIRPQLLEPTVEPNNALLEEVARLRGEGWRTGVITNSVIEHSEMIARLLPWDDLFDVVVDSSQVGMRRPEDRIFARALVLLGLGTRTCPVRRRPTRQCRRSRCARDAHHPHRSLRRHRRTVARTHRGVGQ